MEIFSPRDARTHIHTWRSTHHLVHTLLPSKELGTHQLLFPGADRPTLINADSSRPAHLCISQTHHTLLLSPAAQPLMGTITHRRTHTSVAQITSPECVCERESHYVILATSCVLCHVQNKP